MTNHSGGRAVRIGIHIAACISLLLASTAPALAGSRRLSVSPSSLSFGTQTVNTSSAPQAVVIRNGGNGTVTVQSVNASNSAFVVSGFSGATTLPAGQSLTLQVTFSPTTVTSFSATLTITSDAVGSAKTVSLSGTAVSSPTPPTSTVAVAISPTSVTLPVSGTQQFSATVSGTTTTSVTWQVNGITGGNSTVGTISTSGYYTAPASVPSGGSVTATAVSVADTTKSASASVTISAPVTASGPAVSLSPTSLNFGSVAVGSTSSTQYVTVTNTGSTSLSFSTTFAFTGDFSTANTGTCSMSLAAGASCTASVKFTPTASGTRTGTLTMYDNAGNSPQAVALTGTGGTSSTTTVAVSISPTSATLQVSATQQFSATVSGTSTTSVTWQVNGITGGNSTVGTISTSGYYTAPATVPSGGSVTVKAISAADMTKSASATVTIAAATSTVGVTISPTSVSLTGGQSQPFTATVTGTTNTSVIWQVNGTTGGNSTVGTISTAGLYTAPVVSSNSSFTVTARSYYDSTKYANAAVSVAATTTSSGPALYVSTSGSDSNSCTSSAPCATIKRASQLATAGTTVHVAPGTYTGGFATTSSGTASAPITYISDTKWGAKLVGSGSGIVWQLNASYNVVRGFDMAGGSGDAFGIYIGWSGSGFGHNQIIGNRIHDFTSGCNSTGGAGIETGEAQAGYNLISGNVVANMMLSQVGGSCYTVQGIYLDTSHDLVVNNLVYGVAEGGIQQWHGASNSTIVNNTVFHCNEGIIMGDGDGYSLPGGSANNFVANNIVVNNQVGIDEMGTMGSGNSYQDNLVYNNGRNLILSTATATGTVTADPLFVNFQLNGSGDYHLQAGSPAIDRGTPTNAPATDFDGKTRTAVPDIGAYEY